MLTSDILTIIEGFIKAIIFVPIMALVAWWLFSSWLDNTLTTQETAIGGALLAVAFGLGVGTIARGGWGFLGILATVYLILFALVCWEYIYWRRRERQHLLDEVLEYQEAAEADPTNAAAYSLLGETLLKLSRFDEAREALEHALDLDPQSKTDQSLLRMAREGRYHRPVRGLD